MNPNKTKENVQPTEEDIKKAQKAKKREKKNAAYEVIKELVNKQQDSKYKEALAFIRPSLYGLSRGGGGSSKVNDFINLVKSKGSINETEVFKETKMGRKECTGVIRKHLKTADKDKRVWISFNKETGIYKVEGSGEKAPQNWEGFVPTDENIDLGLK